MPSAAAPINLALQRDAVLVAAGDLQDRLDARADEQGGGRKRAHMGAGAGAVGDIDRVGEALERRRLAQQIVRRRRTPAARVRRS